MSFIDHFAMIEDPRSHINMKHDFRGHTVVDGKCRMKKVNRGGGLDNDIKEFGDEKLAWLREYRSFSNGVPVDDTIARVVRAIRPGTVQSGRCINWVNEIRGEHGQAQIALDGKTLRRSHDGELAAGLAQYYGLGS